MQVGRNRQQSLAIRWLLIAVREKKGRPTCQKLADAFGLVAIGYILGALVKP